ncbi:MAG: hypothetical protein NZ937_07705 [Armatimonadetes bacterium]|nr:hypothetical protein [Armatimonadota bacterium]
MTAGFWMHNSPYRVTVQWRYWVQMKGQRGPFQTSIEVNVQNLVVTSGDVGKVLKWDPERPELCDTSFSYSITCAQRRPVQVKISIYSMDGAKVYELTEQKICPGSYSFTWDGSVNTGYYGGGYEGEEPTNVAPSGLYTFDVEVIGPAYYYDADWIRSKALTVDYLSVEDYGVDESTNNHIYLIRYALSGGRNTKGGEIRLYDPDFLLLKTWNIASLECLNHNSTDGLTANSTGIEHSIWVSIPVDSMSKRGIYHFVLYFKDDFADQYKAHQFKFTLPIGRTIEHTFCAPDSAYDSAYYTAYALAPSQKEIPIPIPDRCPPRGSIPRPADIDGDGVNDWDYPSDIKIPSSNFVVGLFGIRRGVERGFLWWRTFMNTGSLYSLRVGLDSNNNGLLEPNEIQYRIGQCPWPYGMNRGYIRLKQDGKRHVHWESYNDSNRNGQEDPGEPKVHFIYDPLENRLKVYRKTPQGIVYIEYIGNPDNYPGWLSQ